MNKKSLQQTKEKLEREKAAIEQELKKFATEDPRLKGDWDTKFPKFNGGVGSQALEDAADQVEEYSSKLSIEHNLEIRLKNINAALEKIEKGKYGICEKCGEKIPEERLKIHPEAKNCNTCNNK